VQSYRDLPLLINQWANVVRWEMRTRMFLRTAEFLWQEGHTAHATADEARAETMRMLDIYADFAENWMAVPVIKGEKTEGERFPGAASTFSIEAMMQDRKALQAATSHFLGQNFARASNIAFLDQNGTRQLAWTTSWGCTTRLIGAMIMTHADDDGFVLPPKLAPIHVAIVPIAHSEDAVARTVEYSRSLAQELRAQSFAGRPIEVRVDETEGRGGDKVWSWIKKGVPVRLEI
jgi:prolyl-tRNA synthetase